MIIDRRDHVFITFLVPLCSACPPLHQVVIDKALSGYEA
jgi:hypothetical protein